MLTVKQALAIPCVSQSRTEHQSQPSEAHTRRKMNSRQGQADATNNYIKLIRRFSNAQTVVQLFVFMEKKIFEEFPFCSGVLL